jgi:hypothetical protein
VRLGQQEARAALARGERRLDRTAAHDLLLQLRVRGGHHLQAPLGLLRALARRDVADVALDDGLTVLLVEIGHDLDLVVAAVPALERQILVANTAFPFQLPHHGLARRVVLEQTDLVKLLPHQLLVRVAEKLGHERIRAGDLSRDGIEQQHAIQRGLEQPAVADLGDAQPLIHLSALGDVVENDRDLAAARAAHAARVNIEPEFPHRPGLVLHA